MANLNGNSIKIVVNVLLAAFLAAGCASQKIVVKPAGDEISDIQVMLNQLGLKGWRGPLSDMKEKITDQLERVQYGLRNDKMTNVQAAQVIAKAQDVISKIDDMAGSSTGKHPHSAGGENQGGYGEDNGESSGGSGSGNSGGNGNGGYGSGSGGGHHHHGGSSGNTGNADLNDRINDVSDLKELVDSFYAASTATAVTPTASEAVTATASAGTTTTANTK
jgi:hypothetical protein